MPSYFSCKTRWEEEEATIGIWFLLIDSNALSQHPPFVSEPLTLRNSSLSIFLATFSRGSIAGNEITGIYVRIRRQFSFRLPGFSDNFAQRKRKELVVAGRKHPRKNVASGLKDVFLREMENCFLFKSQKDNRNGKDLEATRQPFSERDIS